MPMKSIKQARFLFSQKPDIAKEFASKTKDFKKLPEQKEKAMKRRIDDATK